MKLLNFVITTIICFQFVYQPIAIAQVWYDEPVQGISIDNTISQLKNILRSKALEGFKFLDENKNEISIDDLVRLKDKTFYLLSPDNDPRVEQFAVKVKLTMDIKENSKIKVFLQVLDKSFNKSLAIQSFDIDPKDSENLAIKVNRKLKVLADSVKRSISKRGPASSMSNSAYDTVLFAVKFTTWVGAIAVIINVFAFIFSDSSPAAAKKAMVLFLRAFAVMALGLIGHIIIDFYNSKRRNTKK